MADYDAISKVIRNAIRKEVDKQIDAAYRRGYADGKARIEPTIANIKEYEEKQAQKNCENCECFGDITECKKRPCYSHSCWTPKQAEIQCNVTDKEITESFIEDVSAVKDQLPYKNENGYRNNKYYNTFPTSKETADEIKAEYDEETRSYTYTVDDDESEITVDQAIYNLKRGYGIPHKHKTLALAIEALKMMKENSPVIQMQEPKVGHWIMSEDGLYRPICDNCGAHPWKGYIPTVEEATEVFKYCPNCSAKMIEPQERSE